MDMADHTHRVRLKLPSGAELEAEGTAEFVLRERQDFLLQMRGEGGAEHPSEALLPSHIPNIAWDAIVELHGHNIQLRTKLRGDKSEKDACLVLLAASQKLLSQPKPTSAQLAKWMRASGYPIQRMDRALQDGVEQGEILSSGSRRARRYELTAPGRLKAHILANQLTALVTGRS
jgi:hypothetical protein